MFTANGVPIEIGAAFVALLGAAGGYFFREFQNRVHPLFHVLEIETPLRASDPDTLGDSTVEALKASVYMEKIANAGTIRDIWVRYDRADDLKRFWPPLRLELKSIVDAEVDSDFVRNLAVPFGNMMFERWLIHCLMNNKIVCRASTATNEEKISVHDDKGRYEGSVWLGFPDGAKNFGNDFNKHPVRKAKSMQFVEIVRKLDVAAIKHALRAMIDIFDHEYSIAMQVIGDLEAVVNKHQRWSFVTYFANIGVAPVLLEASALLKVNDKASKMKFIERCEIATVVRENEGKDFTSFGRR